MSSTHAWSIDNPLRGGEECRVPPEAVVDGDHKVGRKKKAAPPGEG